MRGGVVSWADLAYAVYALAHGIPESALRQHQASTVCVPLTHTVNFMRFCWRQRHFPRNSSSGLINGTC
jgi:hypothetical protein